MNKIIDALRMLTNGRCVFCIAADNNRLAAKLDLIAIGMWPIRMIYAKGLNDDAIVFKDNLGLVVINRDFIRASEGCLYSDIQTR